MHHRLRKTYLANIFVCAALCNKHKDIWIKMRLLLLRFLFSFTFMLHVRVFGVVSSQSAMCSFTLFSFFSHGGIDFVYIYSSLHFSPSNNCLDLFTVRCDMRFLLFSSYTFLFFLFCLSPLRSTFFIFLALNSLRPFLI